MKIYYSSKFAKEYRKLPASIKLKAEKKEKLFRKNPFDPRLKTHKLKGILAGYLAFSIDYQYRIIFEFRDEKTVWFHSVGTHEIYELYMANLKVGIVETQSYLLSSNSNFRSQGNKIDLRGRNELGRIVHSQVP